PARVTFPPEDRAEILARINDALVSGALTLGPNGRELEDQFAARHDVPHAVAVSSGTSALEIIFRALGVDGLEVLVPANTFFATAAAALPAGNFGVAASFSFYPTKVMAGGEGGMIVTRDETIAEEAHIYRDQGKGSFHANFHTRLGANWRMSEPHAVIALSQLRRLDEFIAARQSLAKRYDAAIEQIGLRPLDRPPNAHCNYYKYLALLP